MEHMNIRTQSVLAILPIFIGVAVINGFLTYTSEQQENRWALESESTALTVAIAEFMDGDRYASLLDAADDPDDEAAYLNQLQDTFNTLLRHGQAKYVLTRSLDGQQLLHHFSVGYPLDAHHPLPPDAIAQLREQDLWIGPITWLNDDISTLESCGMIRSSETPVAILCTGVSASPFLAQVAAGQRKIMSSSIVVLAVGLILSISIATVMTRKIRQLTAAAEVVAAGQYGQTFEVGMIQEMQDLSNTFNTMSSVMGETLQRAKRSLVENERFRTEQTLATTYQNTLPSSIRLQCHGIDIAGDRLGDNRPPLLLDTCHTLQGTYILFGSLYPDYPSHLDTLVDLSAMATLLKQLLAACPCPEAIAQVASLFPLQGLHCLRIDPEGNTLDHWRYQTAHVQHQSYPLCPTQPWMITLPPTSDRPQTQLNGFLERFHHLPPTDLIADLRLMVQTDIPDGILVVIAKTQAAPQPAVDPEMLKR
jgi:HAMP domain-containing protein